jgi:hypothetical protein
MSMAHGLEVRVPFVDHQLLDAVWPDSGAHPVVDAQQAAAARDPRAAAAARGASIGRSRVHAAFATWMAADLQPFVRSGMAHLATPAGLPPGVPDETWRAGSAAPPLEPPVGARRARRVSEAAIVTSPATTAALASFPHAQTTRRVRPRSLDGARGERLGARDAAALRCRRRSFRRGCWTSAAGSSRSGR